MEELKAAEDALKQIQQLHEQCARMMEVVNGLKSLVEAAAVKHNVDMIAFLGSVSNYLCFEFNLGGGNQLGDAVKITDSQAEQIMRDLWVIEKH